jgi:hypothetical protein
VGKGRSLSPVPGELLFRLATGHLHCYVPNARLMRPYVHPLNVADFKGIRAGQHFGEGQDLLVC